MYIVDVAPLSRGISKESLSYFTPHKPEIGSLVRVPLRKKIVSGIVIDCASVEERKSEIRSAPFEIKKVSDMKGRQFFLKEFIEACQSAAFSSIATTGSFMNTIVPDDLLEALETIETDPKISQRGDMVHEKYLIQADEEERFAHYKSLIREQFAKKHSLFFCLPSIQEIEVAFRRLEKGVEQYCYIFHSGLSEKQVIDQCKRLLAEKHPVLILGTVPYLSIPRGDIGAIVLERHYSRAYKTQGRPFIDLRVFAEHYAKRLQAKLILGDIFLDTETIFRYQQGEFIDLYPPKFRTLSSAQFHTVDMKGEKHGGSEAPALSKELKALIQSTMENNERLFIFSARKGLAPTTICGDCGTMVTCRSCGNGVVLHSSPKANFFLCHKCGERRGTEERCTACDSWRLVPLGMGIDRIKLEVEKLVPEANVAVMDRDSVKTHKKAKEISEKFYRSPRSILIGTEMALPYLEHKVENTAIASMDGFFAIPDYRILEKMMSILLKVRSITKQIGIVQTRKPEELVFEFGSKGNMIDFYREEMVLRKQFLYPPFSTVVKISLEGNRDDIAAKMAEAQKVFEPEYTVDVFPSFVKGQRGQSMLHAVVKILDAKNTKWPDEQFIRRALSLSPQFEIRVDPENLL